MMAALAKSAVHAAGYKVDTADGAAGTVTFTTGMTMGSWSGVSGTVIYREVSPYRFEASGAAKQNVKGGQAIALDLFGEAKSKVDNVIHEMKRLAQSGEVSIPEESAAAGAGTGCAVLIFVMGAVPSLWALKLLA
jgi:hypothetical protein